ncbi:MAG: sulfatase-like hydrolase/transferase [Planctomycetota bacterium]|nr:MAG: sulfatase-like hydrolase/transferase [Planctomycetota bacterium]
MAAIASSTWGAGAYGAKTNFVIILCDDLGYGDLGCYGHPTIKTPNLDRLAGEGMRLTDCYAAAPVCSPARAGMLTGRTPYRCGIYDWIPNGYPMHLRQNEITVATLLKSAGYATCFVGKWHCNGKFNSPQQPQPDDHGFDYWFATQNNADPSHQNPVNFVRNGNPVGPLKGSSSTLIVDEAVSWLAKRDTEKPFCLFVWFHTPHEPIATAVEFVERYKKVQPLDRAIHYGNVTQMDHEVGRLMKTLDNLKLRENTFVFFTSDNGPETLNRYPSANRSYGSPGPLRGMKLHMYEGGIRVPGIIRWPGKTKAGQVCREPINGTDVLPTLCAIAGAQIPADRPIDGASILPLFEGKPIKRNKPLYWQYDKAIGDMKVAMRVGYWKILANAAMSQYEIYDLHNDPGETANLAAQDLQRLSRLRSLLHQAYNEVNTDRPSWPALKRTGPKKK